MKVWFCCCRFFWSHKKPGECLTDYFTKSKKVALGDLWKIRHCLDIQIKQVKWLQPQPAGKGNTQLISHVFFTLMFLALSWEVLQNNKQFFRRKNQQTICLHNAFQLANKNVWNYKMTPRYYVKDFRYLRVSQCQSKYQVHSLKRPA